MIAHDEIGPYFLASRLLILGLWLAIISSGLKTLGS